MSTPKPKANRLGRGLDALLPTEIDEFLHTGTPEELTGRGVKVEDIDITVIAANPHQPRTNFAADALAEMADSIKQHGIVQPLIVAKTDHGYQLIAGERRLRAAKLLNLKTVPAIVRSLTHQQQLEIALIENIQRAELSPLEQAAAYRKLRDEFNMTPPQIGQRVGKASTTVVNIMRLLNLPPAAMEALNDGRITEGHARAILTVANDPEAAQYVLDKIIERDLTVRQAEEMGRDYKKDKVIDEKKIVEGTAQDKVIIATLKKYFRVPVRIQKTASGGKLVIAFKNEAQLEKITRQILD